MSACGDGTVTKFKKESVRRTVDTLGRNKTLHTIMKVMNYKFIR